MDAKRVQAGDRVPRLESVGKRSCRLAVGLLDQTSLGTLDLQ